MTGELRHGSERNESCPSCGEWKRADAALCRSCRDEQSAREAKGQLPPRWSLDADAADPAYGRTCPECGGPKRNYHARRCGKCVGRGDALYNIGRTESNITFRHEPTGELRSFQCFGRGVRAQVADGLAHFDAPDEWVVESRSTPESILTDLHREPTNRPHSRNFRRGAT